MQRENLHILKFELSLKNRRRGYNPPYRPPTVPFLGEAGPVKGKSFDCVEVTGEEFIRKNRKDICTSHAQCNISDVHLEWLKYWCTQVPKEIMKKELAAPQRHNVRVQSRKLDRAPQKLGRK